jgi:hypothetical protein
MRAHDRLGSNGGVSTGPVFDDEWLAGALGKPLSDHAGDDVGRAAAAA